MALSAGDVAERLAVVRDRIARAGARPDDVRIVAVTKGHGKEAVEATVEAGLRDVGENYAQELLAKREAAAIHEAHDDPTGPAPCWHFLGHVQRNKVRALAPAVDLWQAVDRVAAGAEIARRAPGASVLVQLNVSGEAQKHGCRPEEAPALVDELIALGLDVRGLMAVGPTGPPEDARPGFRRLVQLADRLRLPERSVGMSDDLEVAVSEGATMVRVGRALFGPRSGGAELRR
ncbi:MAG TPA: YggS family pyridoxal phosphate-dependent enzyme [Acidimicrobiales bacterium]|nr:YggS family pyridoxal phosphate-dependent enzyme [Acidimicrobiales bacterium]